MIFNRFALDDVILLFKLIFKKNNSIKKEILSLIITNFCLLLNELRYVIL